MGGYGETCYRDIACYSEYCKADNTCGCVEDDDCSGYSKGPCISHDCMECSKDSDCSADHDCIGYECVYIPPSVVLNSPENTLVVSPGIQVDFQAYISQGTGEIRRAEFWMDSGSGWIKLYSTNYPGAGIESFTHTLTSAGTYYWKVKACDNTNCYESASRTLIVNTPPSMPTARTPENGLTGVPTPVLLRATVSDSDGDMMSAVFKDGSGNVIEERNSITSGSTISAFWDGLNPGQTYSWTLTVTDGVDSVSTPAWSFTTNQRPYASNVHVTPYNPKTSDDLTCDYDFNDPDGDAEEIALFQWYRQDEGVGDWINLQVNSEKLGSSNFDKNDLLKCSVKVRDEHGLADDTYVSSGETKIQNTPPAITTKFSEITGQLGEYWEKSFTAHDPDAEDTLNWTVGGFVEVNPHSGLVYDTPAIADFGVHEVEIEVSDGEDTDYWRFNYVVESLKGTVPENAGTPFYTTNINPRDCGSLSLGESCQISWSVNATGYGGGYTIFAYATFDEKYVGMTEAVNASILSNHEFYENLCFRGGLAHGFTKGLREC